jgi:hypothetical protein
MLAFRRQVASYGNRIVVGPPCSGREFNGNHNDRNHIRLDKHLGLNNLIKAKKETMPQRQYSGRFYRFWTKQFGHNPFTIVE